MKKKIILFVLFIVSACYSFAAPFKNLETKVTQPDGTELTLYASGDEFFHWVHDQNGYTIVLGDDGYCYYAKMNTTGDLIESNYRVDQNNPASLGFTPWLKISKEKYEERRNFFELPIQNRTKIKTRAPHNGILNNIVVFISFKDATIFSKARSVYDSRLNSTTSSSGSVKDYFNEVSYNSLHIESHLYPYAESTAKDISYVDYNDRGYYQPYNAATNPIGYRTNEEYTNREHSLIVSAINYVKNAIEEDFTADDLDRDGDGLVDNICFIIQGSSDGWSDLLWAHRWVLYTRDCYIHDKKVFDYVFQPENQVVTKTLCHEMFHALGAPDLYHYDANYTHLDPVGDWDLMNSGWCHMGAYMKWRYANQNWVFDMPLITTSGRYELLPLSQEPSSYKINSTNPNEYYVLEYRLKEGKYEKNLRRSGLLIYRINTTVSDGNRNGPPDEVYIYRPYGSLVENGYLDEAAYMSMSGPVISDKTFPKPFLSDNSDGGLRISNLSLANGKMSFDVEITTTGLLDPSLQKDLRLSLRDKTLYVEGVNKIKSITVYNTNGEMVAQGSISESISLASLTSGMYIVEINADNNNYREKIIL